MLVPVHKRFFKIALRETTRIATKPIYLFA